jgi:diguanylate cyclase (GGDEF)-like protein
MQSILKNEVFRCQRYASFLSLIMMNIDRFKNVNYTYGHQKGDDILLDFASTMKKFCRSNDVAARYSSEEFVLVLSKTKVKGGCYIAERIREEIASQTFQHKGEQTVKVFITQDAQFQSPLSVSAIFVPCFRAPN